MRHGKYLHLYKGCSIANKKNLLNYHLNAPCWLLLFYINKQRTEAVISVCCAKNNNNEKIIITNANYFCFKTV